jgi:hypothetical protein
MKWTKRGWLAPSLTSDDGQWEIFYGEYGGIICRKVGTHRGWVLDCNSVDGHAANLAEKKINKYLRKNNLDDVT